MLHRNAGSNNSKVFCKGKRLRSEPSEHHAIWFSWLRLLLQDMSFSTPEAAETAFYAAFEARSLDAMMAVWSGDDGIACIHPLAAPLNGRAAVATGWHSMFEAAGQFRVQV